MTFEIETTTGQIGLDLGQQEYTAFTEKFKAKKTTDDCYTPENIFEAVAAWVAKEYHLDPTCFVRPFWPGADYTAEEYPAGCVVVDNPPFSIRADIVKFYLNRGVSFFLFSPALTLLTREKGVCHIAVGENIIYENGAEVPTSFCTNLEPDCVLRTAPGLRDALKTANKENLAKTKKQLPKYAYPDEVVTAAIAQRWCHYGVDYKLAACDACYITSLDAQCVAGKSIFGGGYLLSERAAAERAAAERAAAERAAAERAAATRWTLSARERAVQKNIGGGNSFQRKAAAGTGRRPAPVREDGVIRNVDTMAKRAAPSCQHIRQAGRQREAARPMLPV